MAARDHRPVAIGIAGCGEVTGQKHLRVLREIPGARVIALADRDPRALHRVADRYGVSHRYAGIEEMLGHPGLEAVGVCVPPSEHAAVALAAIEAGKHVYVEKPLALSLEDADRMIEACHGRPQKHLAGFHMRWHRLIRQGREMLQSGRVGKVESIRTLWFSPRADAGLPAWRFQRETGGGALIEIAVHCFDLWRHLTGAEVEEVFALTRGGVRDDEAATVTARLSSGALAVGVFSERTAHEIEVEICGDRGRLRIGCQLFDGLQFLPSGSAPGRPRARLESAGRFLKELPGGLRGMPRGGDYLASYAAIWRHFCRVIRHGEKPGCTLRDGRRALEVCLSAVQSATNGRPVVLQRAPE